MPKPNPEQETRVEWIKRCVPVVIEDGTAKEPKQAVAICVSMWNESLKKSSRNGA